MHMFKSQDVTFYHHGDFSGDVIISQGHAITEEEITVPFEALKALVAEYVRRKAISYYESASPDQLLSKVTEF